MPISFKAIVPKPFNSKGFDQQLLEAMQELIDEADEEFAKTYKDFNHKPKFEKEVKDTGGEIVGSTLTSGEPSKDNPYPWVQRGTRVRRARMTPNFVPKTQPGVISSRSGQGGVLFVSKKLNLPGIEARNSEKEIGKIIGPRLFKKAQKALDKAAKLSGHAL